MSLSPKPFLKKKQLVIVKNKNKKQKKLIKFFVMNKNLSTLLDKKHGGLAAKSTLNPGYRNAGLPSQQQPSSERKLLPSTVPSAGHE